MRRVATAMHVATTRRTYKGKTYTTYLLRHTYREGGKVKHKTLANLSHLPLPTVELVKRSLRGEVFLSASEDLRIVSSRSHGAVYAVLGMIRKLGLDKLIYSRNTGWRRLVLAMAAYSGEIDQSFRSESDQ